MRCLRRQLPDRSHLALIQSVMELKKPIGNNSGRLFCILLLLIAAISVPFYFSRELWFDEVLTLQFASLPSAAEIYRTYTIPNNQIIHTILLHHLLQWGFTPESARIFPLLCAVIMIFLLYKNFNREIGKVPLMIALGALILSPPFWLYASSLRGYMLAAMFTAAALCAGKKYALSGKLHYLAAWFILCILTSGVMPPALAAIGGAGLYIAPYCGKKFWKNRKIYLLAITAFAGFVIFYFPIRNQLFKAFELKEGWHHAGFALLATAIGVGVTFFIPLAAGIFCRTPRLRNWPRTLIWFIPLTGALLPVSPFPRVWFILFPVFALLCGGFLRKADRRILKISAAAVLIWGAATLPEFSRTLLCPAVTLAGQDDFFAPRFARKLFTPHAIADLTVYTLENRGIVPVFASFEADPFALMYAANGRFDLIPDVPPGKRTQLPDNSLIILAAEEEKNSFEKRFNGNLKMIHQNMLHRLYRFRRNI
ncbi:MAG: hypothetical protein J6W00_13055 [Lentisphaeria bacterium]|nr:hypothetical protein [Lentisphaeria bacterium]